MAFDCLFAAALVGLNLLKMKWYAWRGSNARPSVPETDALVHLSYRRTP